MPTEHRAKKFLAKAWHNPYTEKDEVKKEKARIKRENLFSYDSVHIGEHRPGQGELREEVILIELLQS